MKFRPLPGAIALAAAIALVACGKKEEAPAAAAGAVAPAAPAAPAAQAGGTEAAKRWIDAEFQPSVLSKEEQLKELEWFINEQVEEEQTARDIVYKFQLVKDDPAALLDLDRELGARAATPAAPTAE